MNDFDQLHALIRNHGVLTLSGIVIGCLVAFGIMMLKPPVYQTAMIVGPTDNAGMPSLSSILPRGAADAPAIQYFVDRIDAGQSNDFTLFETKVTSPEVLNSLIETLPNMLSDFDNKYLWLSKNIKVRPVGLTPYRKIIINTKEDVNAAQILSALHHIADQSIRSDKKIKTMRRIAYLKEQLNKIKNPDHRDATIALLKEQEQMAMMVSIDQDFAAEIIQPAFRTPEPVSPNPIILFPIFIVIGGLLGFLISGFRKKT
jgi:hypothetical protein